MLRDWVYNLWLKLLGKKASKTDETGDKSKNGEK